MYTHPSILPVIACYAVLGSNLILFFAPIWAFVVILCIIAILLYRRIGLAACAVCMAAALVSMSVSFAGAKRVSVHEEQIVFLEDYSGIAQVEFIEKEYDAETKYRLWLEQAHIFVHISIPEKLQPGDCIKINGQFEQLSETSYAVLLKSQGVYAKFNPSSVERNETCQRRTINNIRRFSYSISSRLGRYMPEPHASFLSGLLFGERKGFSKDLETNLKITGTTHIIAISGYNIALVATISISVLTYVVSRKKALIPIIIFISIFVVFVGFSASVVRAGIMGCIVIIAQHFGRANASKRALLYCMALMTLQNPTILIFDVGFQLSCAATAGILYINPFLKQIISKASPSEILTEELSVTLSAQIATIPISIFAFKGYSLISPVINLIIAPILPIAYHAGFIAMIASYIPQLKGVGLIFVSALLEIILKLIEIAAKTPHAYQEVASNSGIIAACIMILVITLYVIGKSHENR